MKKKSLLFIAFFLITTVCIIFFANNRSNQADDLFREIYNNYENGEYEKALELSKQLPDPYNSYYEKFINYRIELISWKGTGDELLNWLELALKDMDFEKIIMDDFYKISGNSNFLWSEEIVLNEVTAFHHDYEWLKNAFIWYPKFYEIEKSYYTDYIALLQHNRDLFNTEQTTSDILEIPCSVIKNIDTKMKNLCESTINNINKLEETYDIDDDIYPVLSPERKNIIQNYRSYIEYYSLSHRYNSETKDSIFISKETAINNFNSYNKMISIESINSSDIEEAVNQAKEEILEEHQEIYSSEWSIPTKKLTKTIYKIWGTNNLIITEPEYKSISDIIEDCQ